MVASLGVPMFGWLKEKPFTVAMSLLICLVSTTALTLQKSTLISLTTAVRDQQIHRLLRYAAFSGLLLGPQVLSLAYMLWSVAMTTKTLLPLIPSGKKFFKECCICAVESLCVAAMMVAMFRSLPAAIVYPLTSMTLAMPSGLKYISYLSHPVAPQKRPLSIRRCLTPAILLACCSTSVTFALYVTHSMDAVSSLCLALALPTLAFCWAAIRGRHVASADDIRDTKKRHILYGVVRLGCLAWLGVFVTIGDFLPANSAHFRSHVFEDLPGVTHFTVFASLFTLVVSSFLFVFLAYLSLSFCKPRIGITIPSLLSTLVITCCQLMNITKDQSRFSLRTWVLGVAPNYTGQILKSDMFSVITLLCLAFAVFLYLRAFHKLPCSPDALMTPFDLMFDDFSWSAPFLDVHLILSAQTNGHKQQVTSQQTHHERKTLPFRSLSLMKEPSRIFVCATMYRESRLEMESLLFSLAHISESSASELPNVELSLHILFDNGCHGDKLTEPAFQLLKSLTKHDAFHQHTLMPVLYRCAYGLQYRCLAANDVQLVVHLKDNQKCKRKKRWSQAMYMHYIIHHWLPYHARSKDTDTGWSGEKSQSTRDSPHTMQQNGHALRNGILDSSHEGSYVVEVETPLQKANPCNEDNSFILALDGDMSLTHDTVRELYLRCKEDGRLGAVCSRVHPIAHHSSTSVWFQIFEYAQDFWLLKSTQNVFGSVLCCPGCCSMYRVSAVTPLLPAVSEPSVTAAHAYRRDTGEDRWITALIILQGWRVQFVDTAQSQTFCPDSFPELVRQRKRWILSDLANDLLLLPRLPGLVRTHDSISPCYVLYYYCLFALKILCPSFLLFSIVVSMAIMEQVDFLPAAWALAGFLVVYFFVCLLSSASTQIRVTAVYSVILTALYGLTIVNASLLTFHQPEDFQCSSLSVSVFLLPVLATVYAGVLHPRETHLLVYWPVYMLCIPTTSILLPILSLCTMEEQSWGTREGGETSVCCSLPILDCTKNGHSTLPVDDSETVEFNGGKDEDPTFDLQDLASQPEHADEASFWRHLASTLLGQVDTPASDSQDLVRTLTSAKYKVLPLYFLANACVFTAQAAVFTGTLQDFVSFQSYLWLVMIVSAFVSGIPAIGLTCHTIRTLIRRLAREVFSNKAFPMWVYRRQDANIRTDAISFPFYRY